MKISLIAAMSKNRVIGRDNQLPWRISEDLKFFKEITLGKAVLMGRKTFESIGRPLPKRENLVLSREQGFQIPGANVFESIEKALDFAENKLGVEDLMVVGGENLYKQLMNRADRIYLTLWDKEVAGDSYFPDFDESKYRMSVLKKSSFEERPLEFRLYELIARRD